MKTLVVSTINPWSNMAYQSACFNDWRKRGYQIISFNNKQEKELLLQYGFDSLDIVEISIEETAFSLFGRAIPRILPILVRSAEFGADNIILVNSDIYPGHTRIVSDYLRNISSTIAMTRSDFIGQPKGGYSGDTHYRGGLDIFFFTADGLKAVLDDLIEIPVAARMTFGVPGWDFFLGHELIHTHSGIIMDGAVMFHQHHKTSYCGVQEFESYAKHLYGSGIYENSSGIDLVSEFSATIQAQCIHNENLSRILSDRFYDPFMHDYRDSRNLPKVSLVYEKLLKITRKFSIKLEGDHNSLAPLISNQLSGEYWEGAVFYKNTKLSDKSHIEGYLLVLLTAMLVKDSRSGSFLTTVYPVGNLHNEVLNRIIRDPGAEGVEVEVLKLFASELVDYSIFNMDLFKYIALSSYTGNSAGLCKGILLLCQKGLMRNIGNYHSSDFCLFGVGPSMLEVNDGDSGIAYDISMIKGAGDIESAKLIIIQAVRRLIGGGIGDVGIAMNTLTPLEDMPKSISSGKDEINIYSYGFLQETMGKYIEEQKYDLLKADIHKNN